MLLRYIFFRVLMLIPVSISISIVIFMIVHLLPGDPIDNLIRVGSSPDDRIALTAKYGLDQSLFVQYIRWVSAMFQGDFGQAIVLRRPVADLISQNLPYSLTLGALAFAFSSIAGITLGTISATTRIVWVEQFVRGFILLGSITVRAHRPMLEEASGGRTDIGPMIDRHALGRAREARKGIYAVSINAAFPCADIAEVGPTVLVTCEIGSIGAQAIADEIADDIWERRDEKLDRFLSVEQAAAIASTWKPGSGPLVIADYADNPGSGAYGDSTTLLAALLSAEVGDACLGPMIDPEAAKALQPQAIGNTVTIQVGGKTAPAFGGDPIELTGTVQWVGDGLFAGSGPILGGQQRSFGATAVLRVQGVDILIVSIAQQLLDLRQFEAFGMDPQQKAVVALKSMQHFRAAFVPIAGRIILCDSGALCKPNYAALDYCHVPRPMYPLDDAG